MTWQEELTAGSPGATFRVRANAPGMLARLASRLPPASRGTADPPDAVFSLVVAGDGPGTAPGAAHRLCRGRRELARAPDRGDRLACLESWLHVTVARHAAPGVFVHAGVVGWQRQAIVLPGRSRAGKSALVAALVRAGAAHSSDEYAVFGPDGRVLPDPKPLTPRGADGRERRVVSAAMLGGRVGIEPLIVGSIVVPWDEPGAAWGPHPLAPGRAALALADNAVAARARPRPTLATLAPAATGATPRRGARGEAEEAAPQMLGAVGALAG